MENSTPVSTSEVSPQKNLNSFWKMLTIITLLIALSSFTFLYYQNAQIRKEVSLLRSSISANETQSIVPTPTSSVPRVYTSEADGFSIALPSNWIFHNDPLRGIWISYPVDNTSIQENPYVNGDKGNVFVRTYSSEKTLQLDLSSRTTFDSNRLESVAVDGEKGIFAPDMVNNGAIILVDHNGKRFEFSFGTVEPSLISNFKEIIASVKFI